MLKPRRLNQVVQKLKSPKLSKTAPLTRAIFSNPDQYFKMQNWSKRTLTELNFVTHLHKGVSKVSKTLKDQIRRPEGVNVRNHLKKVVQIVKSDKQDLSCNLKHEKDPS
jgi:hypothetical protein